MNLRAQELSTFNWVGIGVGVPKRPIGTLREVNIEIPEFSR